MVPQGAQGVRPTYPYVLAEKLSPTFRRTTSRHADLHLHYSQGINPIRRDEAKGAYFYFLCI